MTKPDPYNTYQYGGANNLPYLRFVSNCLTLYQIIQTILIMLWVFLVNFSKKDSQSCSNQKFVGWIFFAILLIYLKYIQDLSVVIIMR